MSSVGKPIVAALLVSCLLTMAAFAEGTPPAGEKTTNKTEMTKSAAPNPVDEGCDKPGVWASEGEPWSEGWHKKITNPTPWFKWYFQFRARLIYDENVNTLDNTGSDSYRKHERLWQRFRSRTGFNMKPLEPIMGYKDLELNVGLVHELYNWCRPEGRRHTNGDEILIETLNLKWAKAFGIEPLTLTIGRQNIGLGNKWLVFEGTPLDGSRTIYFDAIRAQVALKEMKTDADVIFIHQWADPDSWTKPINDRDRVIAESDSYGAIAYVSYKGVAKTVIDAYYIWKHDNGYGSYASQDQDLHTYGARVAGDIDDNLKYRAEIAHQLGHRQGQGVCALGFNGLIEYDMKDTWFNTFRFGYEYRSGDSPGTKGTSEEFDILWGRYPQWSNVYTGYGVDNIDGRQTAQSSNLHRIQFGWSFSPIQDKNLLLCLDYHLLFADKNTYGATGLMPGGSGPRVFSKSGNFRGQLFTALLRYKFNEYLSGHLVGEMFCPGDYYTNEKNDPAFFTRIEILFNF